MLHDTDKKLAEVLHQADANKRLVVYSAIGFAFAQKYVKAMEVIKKNESKIEVKNVAYQLNELAIIEKDSLFKSMMNMMDFKREVSGDNSNAANTATGFLGLVSIEQHFSKNLMESIDANMELFRTTVTHFDNWCKENVEFD